MNPQTESSLRRLARIIELTSRQAMSPVELAVEVHITKRWIYPYIEHLRRTKQIFISSWKVNRNGDYTPKYRHGDKPDSKRPDAKTAQQKAAEYRKRINSDGFTRDTLLARRRAKNRKIKPDPLTSLLLRKQQNG